MNPVQLLHDGTVAINGTAAENAPLNLLGSQIELGPAYCLRSYFEMLDRYTLLARLNDFFPTYQQQYRRCPAGGCCSDDLSALEFHKTIEMIGFPDKRLEVYSSLTGICDCERINIRPRQLADILDLPIRLGKLKHLVFGDQVDAFEFDTVFTLFEFIDGIAWELSFQVGPRHCQIPTATR